MCVCIFVLKVDVGGGGWGVRVGCVLFAKEEETIVESHSNVHFQDKFVSLVNFVYGYRRHRDTQMKTVRLIAYLIQWLIAYTPNLR